ncbi:L,D-transpeptidase family protein [Paracoccus seriniphilus]|uniref:Murein L,D-transpeptidase YcbB/YkuD n=1 Tax=Paracoccus seriniphilus TaxID=184748 RepID=A0A239PMT4_9RHOB|nr:L,D-transpeptidase family protein [Paracoccus seriniphilus]WCR14942.1 L,D-transpeptidase family protein [Paracoccus seriniphilus]SNT71631.1 Murein L,D-transpeptidase YcbB/YkuD [Paracoccus seriniphilus]
MLRFSGFLAASLLSVLCLAGPISAQTVIQIGAGSGALLAPRLKFTRDEMKLAEAVAARPHLAAFYGGNGLKPVFQGESGERLRNALGEAVSQAPRHGLPRSRYRPEALKAATAGLEAELLHAEVLARYLEDMTGGALDPQAVSRQNHRRVVRPVISELIAQFVQSADPLAFLLRQAPRHPAYLALQQALNGPADISVPADLPRAPEAVWRVGMRGAGVLPLRARLASIGFAAEGDDPLVYDAALSAAVARYQSAVGLAADGIAGPRTIRHLNGDVDASGDGRSRKIIAALERMRWMAGEDLDSRHVWVNIPEFTARVIDGGTEVFRTRVVVGKSDDDMQTPEFSDRMEYVVVNPRWNVPRSITVREYLPRLKDNRNALSHLDVVDGRGRVIPRDQIDFSRYTAANFPYRMRQQPGNSNALGLVKFIFPNRWNIYLHDTPSKHLFGNRVRAYSHGCVRVGDPFDLAETLLSAQSSNPGALFRRALDSGQEKWLKLTPELPVHLVYFTAYPDETGRIRYFDDIYGRDDAILRGLDAIALDSGAESE